MNIYIVLYLMIMTFLLGFRMGANSTNNRWFYLCDVVWPMSFAVAAVLYLILGIISAVEIRKKVK